MILSLIAAHDKNLVIGHEGDLPWHFSEDLAFFKRTTMGHPILMGRGVFESLNEKPLPGRRNVVLTRSREYPDADVEVYSSIEAALDQLRGEEKVYVIGGGEIYRQLLDRSHELVITEIPGTYEGDTWFPEYRKDLGSQWREAWSETSGDLRYIRYERIRSTP